MEKAHKMQEKKKSISGRKTDKTGKPAIWQLRGRGFYAGNEKEEKNLQSVILDMVNRFGYLGETKEAEKLAEKFKYDL